MRKFQQSEVELRNNLARLKAKLEEENRKQEDENVLFAIDKCWENRSPHKKYCIWVVKLLNYLKSEEEKSKLQTEMKLSREEMELALEGVLQGKETLAYQKGKEILEIRGNWKYDCLIRSTSIWCRFEGVRVENSGGRIAEDGVEKNGRIRNHMCSKQQKRRKMTSTSIYMYMMVDIDARTGVGKIEIQGP